ncbi:MAG: glycosyltransferase family 2 protein [Roseiflexaceae bacterium]
MKLAVIIVSWNVRDLIGPCIASIHATLRDTTITYTIVVVDNASHDGTVELLREEYPEVHLIAANENLGFAKGNNQGLRAVLSQPQPPEQILLLNPDTVVVGDAIMQMIDFLHQHPDVAVIGPQLRYGDGSLQSSRRRFPDLGVFIWESTPLEWRWPHNPWVRRYRMQDQPDDQVQDVDWLVGAALLVRREALTQAGLFDPRFTLYSEELEWQRRLRRVGRIVYLPTAIITHYEGQSSGQIPTRRLILFHTNRLRYISLVHGGVAALGIRIFLLLAYTIELLIEAAKGALGHRRDLRAERVASYRALLIALLRS